MGRIVVGTNATGGYDDLEHRFDSWATPVIVSLTDNWVGELPVLPVISGGADIVLRRLLAPTAPLQLCSGPRHAHKRETFGT